MWQASYRVYRKLKTITEIATYTSRNKVKCLNKESYMFKLQSLMFHCSVSVYFLVVFVKSSQLFHLSLTRVKKLCKKIKLSCWKKEAKTKLKKLKTTPFWCWVSREFNTQTVGERKREKRERERESESELQLKLQTGRQSGRGTRSVMAKVSLCCLSSPLPPPFSPLPNP